MFVGRRYTEKQLKQSSHLLDDGAKNKTTWKKLVAACSWSFSSTLCHFVDKVSQEAEKTCNG